MNKHILIVEDEKDLLTTLEYNFQKEGYKTTGVTSGKEAIEALHNKKPDLLILDLMLPDISGLEVCKEIRNKSKYEDIFISPSIDISYEDISTDATATAAVKKMEGSFSNIDLGYGISLDKRNQTFQPTDGYKTNFIQTLPLIQDSSSILTGLSGSIYHSLSEDVVGSIKYYMRSVHGVDGDVRLTNRLFLPAKRLRGFQASKVGPIDGDDFVGGNYVTALGFEASLPNLLPETLKTDISVFLDTGNVWSVDYNESLDDSNKIRSSVGISANVFTVMGPLNFTLAQDLTKASTDLTERFNFRLGTSF